MSRYGMGRKKRRAGFRKSRRASHWEPDGSTRGKQGRLERTTARREARSFKYGDDVLRAAELAGIDPAELAARVDQILAEAKRSAEIAEIFEERSVPAMEAMGPVNGWHRIYPSAPYDAERYRTDPTYRGRFLRNFAAYYARHKDDPAFAERLRAKFRAYYGRNREQIAARKRQNGEYAKMRERFKAWAAANPERRKEQKRKARERVAADPVRLEKSRAYQREWARNKYWMKKQQEGAVQNGQPSQ